MRTSWLQSYLLPPYAKSLTWHLAEGPSDAIVFPAAGPYDQRLGYAIWIDSPADSRIAAMR